LSDTETAPVRIAEAVRRHGPVVFRVLRRAGLAPADAEDASQDVFEIFLRRVASVSSVAERAFLISTALRVAADRRRSKWRTSVSEPLDLEQSSPDAVTPEDALDLVQARALLDRALDALDQSEREVFILAELEQMTRDEVASVLGLAPGTVASRLRRAREAFEAAVRRIRLSMARRSP
jgi:RNA polymerase sigma-70 factor (ECF subfamily)